ncbi:Ribonuclease CAF1 [Corchorus capsularis]|uniref:Ribonuclease CAF1 n=1 Tax=Corchorus capsularis TaxID=210143 RepID=A0A1R3IW43_COCAP|nr:Ribonuclease CAF1 [Corchorus capsularis]
MVALIRSRLFCTKISQNNNQHRLQWSVKQVTKSNFNESLQEFRSHLSSSDFVAISLQNTGSFSSAWHRVSSFDTPEIAYLKARRAAERFQILQFAVCPFTISGSKVTAHPYNFHLFPRDEFSIGMPSFSFSCQTSYLTAMAQQGFDFNACIYDGISYLSRAQELVAKVKLGNPIGVHDVMKPSSTPPSVADTIFVERVKLRIKNWKKACTDSSGRMKDEALIKSLRKLVLGSEQYGSRPCMTIDVCSERQVQLVLEMLAEFSDDLVALKIPTKGGGIQAVRVVLTDSKDDKSLFERELQNVEEDQNKKIRGFREVIDLISASQKPVVSHNSLNDFSVIHSKFISPLPFNMDEFLISLRSVFPHILDVNHLMKRIGPLENVTSIPAAIAYLKNRFFAPIDMEVYQRAFLNEGKVQGQTVLRICHLFAKLCYVLRITPGAIQSSDDNVTSLLDGYGNAIKSCFGNSHESVDGGIRIWTKSPRKVGCEDLVFLWGFRDRLSAGMLKSLLQGSHDIFSEEFDVCLVDKSCAIVAFMQPNLSQTLLDIMNSEGISGSLRELVSEGLRAAGYETYKKACSLGLWEVDLASSLEKAFAAPDCSSQSVSETKPSEIYWCSDLMINFDDL